MLFNPTLDAVVVGLLVAGAVAYGLRSNQDLHRGPWRSAWHCLGAGLVCVALGDLLQAAHAGGPPTQVGIPMILNTGGDLLAIVGLVSLIHQRLPERSADSLAEALLSTLALGFVILALVVVPSQGWRPGFQIPAIVAPLLDMIILWLVCSLVSLTERHPVIYRYLIAGFVCLFVADASYSGLALSGGVASSTTPGVSSPSSGRACGGWPSSIAPARWRSTPCHCARSAPEGCGWPCSWRWGSWCRPS